MASDTSLPKDPPLHIRQLLELEVICPDRLVRHWPRTRDSDIPVLKDPESGIIFLSEALEVESHYGQKTIGKKQASEVPTKNGVITLKRHEDADRRLEQTSSLLKNKRVCDFGTGRGLFLDDALTLTGDVTGIEIRQDLRDLIDGRLEGRAGLAGSLSETSGSFDLVTLFHVLEHLPDQLGILREIREALAPGGTVFIEVPHAADFLAEEMALPEYRDFIYWSEHLVLHTTNSLKAYLEATGFCDIEIQNFQRYGYANHLYWLRERKPGGHEHYDHLTSADLDQSYRAHLARLGRADTLIAIARRPG